MQKQLQKYQKQNINHKINTNKYTQSFTSPTYIESKINPYPT